MRQKHVQEKDENPLLSEARQTKIILFSLVVWQVLSSPFGEKVHVKCKFDWTFLQQLLKEFVAGPFFLI